MRELRTGDTVAINDPDNYLNEIGMYNGAVHKIERFKNVRWDGEDVRYVKLSDCENLILCDRLLFIESENHFEQELFEL